MRMPLIVLFLLIANSAAAAEVRLRSAATCASPVVRLDDVAEIDAADAGLAAALGEIPLCPAPSPGRELALSQHDVRQLLAQSGVERGDFRVTGSERVTVVASASSPAAPRALTAAGVRQTAFAAPADNQPAAAPPVQAATSPAMPVRLIERGESVNVYARAAGVRIATSGKALQPGAAGETILIELAGSKEKVQARVVAAQAVEVAVRSHP